MVCMGVLLPEAARSRAGDFAMQPSTLQAQRTRVTIPAMSHSLFQLLLALDAAPLYYALARDRPDSLRVNITLVGERIEVDVFDDGHMEVSRFVGSEDVVGDATLVEKVIAENT
jgi:hypothetical protein